MNRKLSFLFILYFFVHSFLFAQKPNAFTAKIDSLTIELGKKPHDTLRVKLLNLLAQTFSRNGQHDNALEKAVDALELARNQKMEPAIAFSYYLIGNAYREKDMYDQAIEFHEKSLAIRQKLKDTVRTAGSLQAIGTVYKAKGELKKALDYQTLALKVRLTYGDELELARSYNSIGGIYFELADYNKSLDNFLNSLRIYEKFKSEKDVASVLNNIASIYLQLSEDDKALQCYLKALEINERSGNKKWKAINLSNMGNIYSRKKDIPAALDAFNRSIAIREEIGDRSGLGTTYMNISILYENNKDYEKAIEFGEKALKIRTEIADGLGIASSLRSLGLIRVNKGDIKKGIEDLESSLELCQRMGLMFELKSVYNNLSFAYEKKKDDKNALKYYKLYQSIQDSIFNQDNRKNLAELDAKYQTEKKDNQIKLLEIEKEKDHALNEAERKKQNIIQIAGASILLLVLIVTIVMFNAYRRKKRDNKEIKLQKEIIENKSKEVEASITYARRIQSAILPPDNFISTLLPSSFVLYQPKDIVSGDFYWVEKVGRKILIAVVDCTGHGVPGAMVSVVGNNALNRTIKEFKLTEPALILDKLNSLVEETFEKSENEVKDGMDISLCSFDPDTLQLEWAGANNPIWILNGEGMKEIKGDKQPIGKFIHRKPFTSHKIQLKKGDSFYLFSDGLADQFGGPRGKKFKYKQFMNLLIESKSMSKANQKEILLKSLQAWKGDLEQIDDICVVGVEV